MTNVLMLPCLQEDVEIIFDPHSKWSRVVACTTRNDSDAMQISRFMEQAACQDFSISDFEAICKIIPHMKIEVKL